MKIPEAENVGRRQKWTQPEAIGKVSSVSETTSGRSVGGEGHGGCQLLPRRRHRQAAAAGSRQSQQGKKTIWAIEMIPPIPPSRRLGYRGLGSKEERPLQRFAAYAD